MTQVLSEEWQRHIASVVDHWSMMARESIGQAALEHTRPSVLFKPRLSIDGDQWCALYGDNLQDGVAGFGKSPQDAMWDFDAQWGKALESKKSQADANALLDSLGFPSLNGIKKP